MYKFGFNFFKIRFQFAPCMGQCEIIPGQTGLNKKKMALPVALSYRGTTT